MKGSKLDGDFTEYMHLVPQKYKDDCVFVGGNGMVVDYYDRSDNFKSEEGCTNLISFSSHFLYATFHAGVTTGESMNITTWQQVTGYEKSGNVFPVVVCHYAEKRQIRK